METGQVVGGKYRLRKKVGEGAMGSVWSAVHETLDRTVAIKFLQPSGEDKDTASARFVAEARSAARVKHRFVVDVFDFGITELGEYYMVQELLEGEELADSMLNGAAWEASDVVRFVAHCLTGLEAVHQARIIHRDLKPENIFVMRDLDGRFPKLVDFGISKATDPVRSRSGLPPARGARPRQLTMQGTTVGTPWYMSPEQLRGRRDLDARADLYSIGVILYEWLTGQVPYAEENLAELALKIAAGSALPLVSIRPELGHALSGVLARAMAPEPEGRFASAAEMREALTAVIPTLPQAWSVVQKGARPGAPAAATPHKPLARSARTEALLVAAERSFGDAADDSGPTKRRRSPLSLIALGALGVFGLTLLPWLQSARPERASAHGSAQPAAHHRPRTGSTSVPVEVGLAPVAAQEPLVAETADDAAAAVARTSSKSGIATSATPARALRKDTASHAQARPKSRSVSTAKTGVGAKTLIQKLDF